MSSPPRWRRSAVSERKPYASPSPSRAAPTAWRPLSARRDQAGRGTGRRRLGTHRRSWSCGRGSGIARPNGPGQRLRRAASRPGSWRSAGKGPVALGPGGGAGRAPSRAGGILPRCRAAPSAPRPSARGSGGDFPAAPRSRQRRRRSRGDGAGRLSPPGQGGSGPCSGSGVTGWRRAAPTFGQAFVEDPSNRNPLYARARLRARPAGARSRRADGRAVGGDRRSSRPRPRGAGRGYGGS